MVPFFPKQISYRAISIYLFSLLVISLVFIEYTMTIGYILMGILSVAFFFLMTSSLSQGWRRNKEKDFTVRLFSLAISLRVIWVIVSYFFYIHVNGDPFEFSAADSIGYHEEAIWLASEPWDTAWLYYFGPLGRGLSDAGYPLLLIALYKLIGPSIIVPRIIKAILSTITCVLVYKLAARSFGEDTGRMAGIMMALMPNLIIYCGYHLKETEMLFLEALFLERFDYLVRSRKASFFSLFLPTVAILLMFFFRTVLGAAAIFAFVSTILVSSTPTMKRGWRRTALIAWSILGLIVVGGGQIASELEGYWEEKDTNLDERRTEQTSRGSQWAHYATGPVMAPMAVVLPFATMVDVDQQFGQQEKSGGNYIRNFMGFFVFLAIYEAIRRKKWRDFAMIGAFVLAYLAIVSRSGFNNSERFLLPALPCLIMMWSYGVSMLRKSSYRALSVWCIVVFFMEVGWAFFKIGSRGFLGY